MNPGGLMKTQPRKPKTTPESGAPAYEPTAHERRSLDAHRARIAEKPPAPRVKVSTAKDGAINIAPDHPDLAMGAITLMDAIGSKDPDFMAGLLNQLGNGSRPVDNHRVIGRILALYGLGGQ